MKKLITSYIFVLAVVLCAVGYGNSLLTLNNQVSASVELGISEVSPRGEAGGFAMPASGASVELSFKQTNDQVWDSSASAALLDDRAVDLKWVSTAGSGSGWTSKNDWCYFSTGNRVPTDIDVTGVSISNSAIGSSYNRHLSLVGGSDTYTIYCLDVHDTDWDLCATEGGECTFSGTKVVSYGGKDASGNDRYTYGYFDDVMQCETASYTFDPLPGKEKKCYTSPSEGGYHVSSDIADLSLQAGWDGIPECSDGYDNADEEDTVADASDPGCWKQPGEPWTYDANDNDEDDNSPSMTLIACESDGVCVTNGGTLKIDDSDEVTLTWTSSNTDFCDSVGTFTMPSGNPTAYTDWNGITEPAEGDPAEPLIVACGNGGTPEVAEVVYVINPTIELIPYPNPPIIPSEGMPPSDPATITPIISTYNPDLCYIYGPGLEDEPSITTMTGDGRLSGGEYDAQLNARGETAYILTCYPDLDADGIADPGGEAVTDTAIFRILPEVQET